MNYSIYTDGATSGNGYEGAQGGWAWILLDENNNIILEACGHINDATNNICELTAIIKACEAVEKIIGKDEKVIVYSDSAYAINGLNDWIYTWRCNNWQTARRQPIKNQELWEKLLPFVDDNRFDFNKVKGHNGDSSPDAHWNDYVDKKAVKAKIKDSKI